MSLKLPKLSLQSDILRKELETLKKLMYRNKNQQRKQSWYGYLAEVLRLAKFITIDSIESLAAFLLDTIITTQSKVTSQVVSVLQSSVYDSVKVLECTVQICINSEKAARYFINDINKGVFAPLYSVLLATTSRIFKIYKNDIVDIILDQCKLILSRIQHISHTKPQYSSLIRINSWNVYDFLIQEQAAWLNRVSLDIDTIQIASIGSSDCNADENLSKKRTVNEYEEYPASEGDSVEKNNSIITVSVSDPTNESSTPLNQLTHINQSSQKSSKKRKLDDQTDINQSSVFMDINDIFF